MLDFSNSKILIVGDVMLDKYYFGKVDRISPEAPVPIVNIQKEESRLGGASNVANNIVSLGGHSLLCGVIGHDLFGKEIERISRHKNIDTFLLKTSSPTITKARIIGGKQQIVRVDYEDKSELNADNKKLFRDTISRILPEQGYTYFLLAKLYTNPSFLHPDKFHKAAKRFLAFQPSTQNNITKEMKEDRRQIIRNSNFGK